MLKIQNSSWPAPEMGFELLNSENEIVAEAKLACVDRKIAVLIEEQKEHAREFKSAGWDVFSVVDAMVQQWDQK